MKDFIYRFLSFVLIFAALCFFAKVDVTTVFDIKEAFFVICGGVIFTLPYVANALSTAKKMHGSTNQPSKTNKTKPLLTELVFAFRRNVLIAGIFVTLIFLLNNINEPTPLSEHQNLSDFVLNKLVLSLRPLLYSFLALIVFVKPKTLESRTNAELSIDERSFANEEAHHKNEHAQPKTDVTVSKTELLSKREIEVAKLAARGLTNMQIADELYISPETVKRHLATVYSKLGIASRARLKEF